MAATGEAPSEQIDSNLEELGDIEADETEDLATVPETPARKHVTFDVDLSCEGCE